MKLKYETFDIVTIYNGMVVFEWRRWDAAEGILKTLGSDVLSGNIETSEIEKQLKAFLKEIDFEEYNTNLFLNDYEEWKNNHKYKNSFEGHIEIIRQRFFMKFIGDKFSVDSVMQMKIDETMKKYEMAIDADISIKRSTFSFTSFGSGDHDYDGYITGVECVLDMIIKFK